MKDASAQYWSFHCTCERRQKGLQPVGQGRTVMSTLVLFAIKRSLPFLSSKSHATTAYPQTPSRYGD